MRDRYEATRASKGPEAALDWIIQVASRAHVEGWVRKPRVIDFRWSDPHEAGILFGSNHAAILFSRKRDGATLVYATGIHTARPVADALYRAMLLYETDAASADTP